MDFLHIPNTDMDFLPWVFLFHLLVTLKFSTVAFNLQAAEHIESLVLGTRFPRAAFFSPTHSAFQVEGAMLVKYCFSFLHHRWQVSNGSSARTTESIKTGLLSYHLTTHTFPSPVVTDAETPLHCSLMVTW